LRLTDAGGLGNHRADDRGRYRIYGLTPGSYIVSAFAGQTPSGDSTSGYAPSYFPGTIDPGYAQWIAVDVAAQVGGIDFALTPVATARVLGIRLNEAGAPARGSIVLSPSRRSGSVAPAPFAARTTPDGGFEFQNVPPGEYVLQASEPRPNLFTEGEFATTFVVVDGVEVSGIVLRTSSGATVRGRVTVDGEREPLALERDYADGGPGRSRSCASCRQSNDDRRA
jgi:hypothetical protein